MHVVSRRTVKPPPRPRERIPLTTWDISMLSTDYIQKGLLYAPPPFSTARLLDHLQAALADALVAYYPVAGRFATGQHPSTPTEQHPSTALANPGRPTTTARPGGHRP